MKHLMKSQKDQIYSYLKKRHTLTPLLALNLFGCFCLAERIRDIRNDGHRVITEIVKTKTGKRVARYSI